MLLSEQLKDHYHRCLDQEVEAAKEYLAARKHSKDAFQAYLVAKVQEEQGNA